MKITCYVGRVNIAYLTIYFEICIKTPKASQTNKKESEDFRVNEKHGKKHPYLTLGLFTVAMAGVINITNKMKKFFKEKCDCVKQMMSMDK